MSFTDRQVTPVTDAKIHCTVSITLVKNKELDKESVFGNNSKINDRT